MIETILHIRGHISPVELCLHLRERSRASSTLHVKKPLHSVLENDKNYGMFAKLTVPRPELACMTSRDVVKQSGKHVVTAKGYRNLPEPKSFFYENLEGQVLTLPTDPVRLHPRSYATDSHASSPLRVRHHDMVQRVLRRFF